MEQESKILHGIGLALTALGTVVYKEKSRYVDPEIGVYFQGNSILTERAVVVRTYPVQDSPTDNDMTLGVQFEIRTPSVDLTSRVASDIRALLHQAWNVTLGGVLVSQSFRQSGTTDDADGRITRTENYYLTVNRPNERIAANG